MAALKSEPLQRFLDAELSAGNSIASGGALEWGSLRNLVILRDPFRTRAWENEATLVFREVNDPHYWKSEVEDPLAGEMVACGFASDWRQNV